MNLFNRRKHSFPSDKGGRRDTILKAHYDITQNNDMVDPSNIDFLLDLISDESDVFVISAYTIFYIGYYKPFREGNEETAKAVSDMILADANLRYPENTSRKLLDDCCSGSYTIDTIAEWQETNCIRI